MQPLKAVNITFSLVLLVALSTPGCAPRSSVDAVPELTLDPTHEVPLIGWWYNGTEALHLQRNSEYQLFADSNRYARPLSNGRWTQKTYATLFLSPYNTPNTMRQRVTLSRDGDHLTLNIPGYTSFLRSDPLNSADMQKLATTWISSTGVLDLRSDQRYVYRPISTSAQAMNVGHRGIWSLKENVVTLFPDPSGVKQVSFEVRQQADATEKPELWSQTVVYRPISQ